MTTRAHRPNRIDVILAILRLPHTREQLKNRLGLRGHALSNDLWELRARGLITAERDGTEIRYRAVGKPEAAE